MDNHFASRKWILALLLVVCAMTARGLLWIDGAQLVSLLTWSAGLYMAGNIGQAVADKISIGAKP